MRFAILCACLLVLCQGSPSDDDTDACLSNLLDMLKKAYNNVQERSHTRDSNVRLLDLVMGFSGLDINEACLSKLLDLLKGALNKLDDLPLKRDSNARLRDHPKLFKRDEWETVTIDNDPYAFDLDRLYEFPGSAFLVDMISTDFSMPGPFQIEWMEDMSPKDSRYMFGLLQPMDAMWFRSMVDYYGDYTGLPEMFTKRVVRWVATARMACPSTFFDKMFARWSYGQLMDMFSTEDEAVATSFTNALTQMFPEMPSNMAAEIASDAVHAMHYWVLEELMQHIYGNGFKDVAVFSHKLFWRLSSHYRNMTGPSPFGANMTSLTTLVKAAWNASNVRCENGTQVLKRHREAISEYVDNYETLTEAVILSQVTSYITRQLAKAGYIVSEGGPSVEQGFSAIADKVAEKGREIVGFLTQHEENLGNGDYAGLRGFFEDLQVEGETDFVKALFTKLGLFPETNPEIRNH